MVGRMTGKLSVACAVALAVMLSGCGWGAGGDAARGIAGFLAAAHRGDQTAFEAGLDRRALRSDLHDQIAELGRGQALDVDGGPSEFMLDRRITPKAVLQAEAHTGYTAAAAPTAAQVKPLLRVHDGRHACLSAPGPEHCVLSFTREKGAWRLTAMLAADLRAAPARN
jgi:hypothetical protein